MSRYLSTLSQKMGGDTNGGASTQTSSTTSSAPADSRASDRARSIGQMQAATSMLEGLVKFGQAQQQARAIKSDIRSTEITAVAEEGEAARAIGDLYDRVAQTVGAQRVAFAASGIDTTSGTAAQVQEKTRRTGEETAQSMRTANASRALQRRAQIKAMLGNAKDVRSAGLANVGLSIYNSAISAAAAGAKGGG
ncbi:MAG: hypothetical protein RLZZ157_92 [Pseudomonadota bacterium]|jgi:hypothetical protein